MKIRLISIILMLGVLLSLCACGEKAKPQEEKKNFATMTFEQLASLPTHIEQAPNEQFKVSADVKNNIKNNLNIFKAQCREYGIDNIQKIFLGDKAIAELYDNDELHLRETADGDRVTEYITMCKGFTFGKQRCRKRELESFTLGSERMWEKREVRYPDKELDFMSRENALNLVKGYAEKLELSVANYNIYSIDLDYINKFNAENPLIEGEPGYGTVYTKEDEYYLIIPQLQTPNGSLIEEVALDVNSPRSVVDSGKVHAIVDKHGLATFRCGCSFKMGEEVQNKKIISINDAIKIISDYYSKQPSYNVTINEIVLSYVPRLPNPEDNINVELRPCWTFKLTAVQGDGVSNSYKRIIDATTGEDIKMNRCGWL